MSIPRSISNSPLFNTKTPCLDPSELEGYKSSLLGQEKKSYHLDLFTRLDHGCIGFQRSYNRKTDGTWKGGMTAKVIVVLTKTVVLTTLTLLKTFLIITIITPIALKCFSMYKNRSIVDIEIVVFKPVETTSSIVLDPQVIILKENTSLDRSIIEQYICRTRLDFLLKECAEQGRTRLYLLVKSSEETDDVEFFDCQVSLNESGSYSGSEETDDVEFFDCQVSLNESGSYSGSESGSESGSHLSILCKD